MSLLSTFFSRLKRPASASATAVDPVSKYRAIAIYRGVVACTMAKKFSEHRFLAREAPTLPLPGCSMPQGCQCRYLKFKDRRAEPRRADDFRAATRMAGQPERRGPKGRRSSD